MEPWNHHLNQKLDCDNNLLIPTQIAFPVSGSRDNIQPEFCTQDSTAFLSMYYHLIYMYS